jgi:hypothetical protein
MSSGKKIILLKHKNSKISYTLQGIPNKELIEYTSKEDMKEKKISEKLKFLKK